MEVDDEFKKKEWMNKWEYLLFDDTQNSQFTIRLYYYQSKLANGPRKKKKKVLKMRIPFFQIDDAQVNK